MKIDITEELIRQLAQLANLKLSEERVQKYQKDLTRIVGYMDEIRELDLHDIVETARVTEEVNAFREDETAASFSQQEALANATKVHKGYFVIPRVLKKAE